MAKSSKVLSTIFKIIGIIVFIIIGALCVAMAYIMFAPDDFPKPFSLVYSTPMIEPSTILNNIINPEPTPTPTPMPTPVILPGDGLMETMSTKIINLAGSSGNQYIRVTVVLEFKPIVSLNAVVAGGGNADPNAALKAEIETRMPIMDDVVITLLATKTYEDLYTAQGKENLRKEIMDAINSRLPEFHIMSVYFTEFVVQ
jgi:flagellar protein FliL